MKKTYLSPNTDVVCLNSDHIMVLTASIDNENTQRNENALSRRRRKVWDEEEEEEEEYF